MRPRHDAYDIQAAAGRLPHAWRVVSLAALAALSACGGGGGGTGHIPTLDPGTPAGTYAVTVTGTSGSNTHSITVSVTVP